MNRSAFCAYCVLVLSACGEVPLSDEVPVHSTEQALTDPAPVLGFEAASHWSVTQGTKSTSTTRSQGAASLALSNFTFTSATSAALSTLPGVTSQMALDVRLPATVSWGQLQLFVSIPSRNVYEAALGQASLVGVPAGSFRTLTFNVPSSVLSALQSTYSDLRFKITINGPQSSQSLLLDNLRFQGAVAADKIEIEVTNVDDFVYASVDGLRRQAWTIGDPQQNTRLDVSHWFGSGSHAFRLQAINTGGPFSYGIRVWRNGALVLDAQCPTTLCNGADQEEGILFEQTLQLSTPNRPASQNLQITSSSAGKLYINDAYTGLTTTGTSSPITVSLPPATYTLGLGVSDDVPPVYTGQYYERQVAVASAPISVNMTAQAPLPVQDTTRIVVIPIRRVVSETTGQVATLTNTDISNFEAQVAATRDQWLEPFSYGLTTWDVDFHPVVENVPVYADNPESAPNTDRFLKDAQLRHLRQQYEIVLYYHNIWEDDGDQLPVSGSAWGGGGQVWINTYWTRRGDWERTGVNPALLHEVLHNYEGGNRWQLGYYAGVGGLHGDSAHGYYPGGAELDFAEWQRRFMRNQVAEVSSMRPWLPQSTPAASGLWVGVFDTVRRGYNPPPPPPPPPEPTADALARSLTVSATATDVEAVTECPAPTLSSSAQR